MRSQDPAVLFFTFSSICLFRIRSISASRSTSFLDFLLFLLSIESSLEYEYDRLRELFKEYWLKFDNFLSQILLALNILYRVLIYVIFYFCVFFLAIYFEILIFPWLYFSYLIDLKLSISRQKNKKLIFYLKSFIFYFSKIH